MGGAAGARRLHARPDTAVQKNRRGRTPLTEVKCRAGSVIDRIHTPTATETFTVNDDAFTDDMVSNNSANPAFENILQARIERRQVLKGGLAVAAAVVIANGFNISV